MSKNKYCCDCEVVHQDAYNFVKDNMLSKEEFMKIETFFKALADNTRLKIVWALYRKELCVCDLANLLSMTKSAVSHQLKVLRDALIVKFRKVGKEIFYTLSDQHISNFVENALGHVKE